MSITITLTDEELSEIATTLEKLAKAIELVNGKPAGIGKYFDQAGERLNRALEKLKAEMEHEQRQQRQARTGSTAPALHLRHLQTGDRPPERVGYCDAMLHVLRQ